MTISEKMSIRAAEIKEAIVRAEVVSKEDLKFLNSFLKINSSPASNGGKRRRQKY